MTISSQMAFSKLQDSPGFVLRQLLKNCSFDHYDDRINDVDVFGFNPIGFVGFSKSILELP